MIRAHELHESSGVCTSSCDAQNLTVTFMLTPCAAEAVPLALFITPGQTEANYFAGFELLGHCGCKLFGGAGYPQVFMTDDSSALHNALHIVWSYSQQNVVSPYEDHKVVG